jgi:hypothetical protein
MPIFSIAGFTGAVSPFTQKANDSGSANRNVAQNSRGNLAADKKGNPSLSQQKLSEEEQQQVKDLAARDREVKAHEAAHKAAGAGLTGAASYSFTTGPDGKRYATGGEVSIDTSEVSGDPQATLLKSNRIRAAALAPAEPSTQDRQVAAQAARMAAKAQQELATEHHSNTEAKSHNNSGRDALYKQTASATGIDHNSNRVDFSV